MLANLGSGIPKFCVFLLHSAIFATGLPVFRDTGSQCVAVRLLACTFSGQDAVGHLVQVDLQKRFLMYQMSSVYQAAGKNRGLSIHMIELPGIVQRILFVL